MDWGVVRLPTFTAEWRRAFGRVVPLTVIDRFWPAAYRSLQWMDSLPGGTVGSWRSRWRSTRSSWSGRVPPLSGYFTSSCSMKCGARRVRQMLRNSLDQSHDAIVVAGQSPSEGTLLASTAAARRDQGPSPASLTKHDPIFTKAPMR